MKFSAGQKIGAGFGVALLLLSVTSVVSYRAMTSFSQKAGWVAHSLRVLRVLDSVPGQLMAAELGQRNYLLTGDESELEPYRVAVGAIRQAIADLRQLTGDNPDQQRRLDALEPLVAKAFAELQETIDLRRDNEVAVAMRKVLEDRSKQLINGLSQAINAMGDEEIRLLKERDELLGTTTRQLISAVTFRNFLALLFVAVAGVIVYRDVVARQQAEEALRRSEEYFHTLIDNTSDLIGILTAEGVFRYQSPAGERMLGYTAEDVIGRSAFEFVHPEDVGKVMDAFARGIRTPGHTAPVEFRCRHKDGSWRVLEAIGKNLLDNPAVAGIVINSRDVTERKRAEQALRESEERFRLLSASSPVGIFSTDVEGACLYTNPRWQEIAGMTLAESLGQGWTEAIAPEDREAVRAEWRACVKEGRDFLLEFRFRRPTGEIRWVRNQATALRSEFGSLLGYVGTSEDITERRRAAIELERLRHQQELILQSVADGIHVLDLQGRAIFVNPAAAGMIGYAVEEMLGQSMHDVLHHSKADGTPYPRAECPISATLGDGKLRHVTDEVFWRKDGTSFSVEYIVAPMQEDDKVMGAVVTFRDISARRAVERMKDEFV
ncbi:MAG TPA: PAS domain S-box protein, partial [Candidatus Binatia bacterium]|nr:PAS domain S-box protein [Candidatus Binatia bacterium]